MQMFDVSAELDGIAFSPGNTYEEILQNVKTILTTIKGSVPLDRGFGMDTGLLDSPINVVKNKLVVAVIETVERYEPRVKVKAVSFAGDGEEGIIRPTVKVVIKE